MTTGVPVPLILLASRLLLLSRWSRLTGLAVVIARGPSSKQPIQRACAAGRAGVEEGGRWMPDEDSNLD